MLMTCTYTTMLHGDIIRAGQTVDLTEDDAALPVVKANFMPVGDSSSHSPAPTNGAEHPTNTAKILVANMTREEVLTYLAEAGQRVPGNISNEKLKTRYEEYVESNRISK